MSKTTKRERAEREQYTRATMLPIDAPEAEQLAQDAADQSLSSDRREALIMLLCGIAAIRDPMRRQEVAFQAALAVYEMGNEPSDALAQLVARLNGEKGEASDER